MSLWDYVPDSVWNVIKKGEGLGDQLRYGLSPEEYDSRAQTIRDRGLPPDLTELSKGNRNIEDRFLGQMISMEQGRPEAGVKFFNDIAIGDSSLQGDEAKRTKEAGNLGRGIGSVITRQNRERDREGLLSSLLRPNGY